MGDVRPDTARGGYGSTCKAIAILKDPPDIYQYGVRHYAHAVCLAKRHGTKAALAMLRYQDTDTRKWFRFDLEHANAEQRAEVSAANKRIKERTDA